MRPPTEAHEVGSGDHSGKLSSTVKLAAAAIVAAVLIAACATGGSSTPDGSAASGVSPTAATGGSSTPDGSAGSGVLPTAAGATSGPCDGHPCIGDWQKEAAKGGTAVQCNDGTWSHAGGLSGACSDHGGESSGRSASGANAPPPSAGGSPGYGVQDLAVQCGYGVAGSSQMTCGFAENAFYEYWSASRADPNQSETINVWSALSNQSYALSCSAGDGVVDCTGTNRNGVRLDARFTQAAISAYTSSEAAAYAASGKLGPAGTTSASGVTPGDHNPNDPNASACDSSMEIGPHSDCSLAQQVAADLAQSVWSAPGSDTVSDGGTTITFNCSLIGQDYSQASQPGIYSCVSQGDSQDWFKFEFT
jgi:hypothetical protein